MHNNDVSTIVICCVQTKVHTLTRIHSVFFFSTCAQFVCSAMRFSNTHMILDAETVWLMLLYIHTHAQLHWLRVIAYALECACMCVRMCFCVCMSAFCFVLFCVSLFRNETQHFKPKTKQQVSFSTKTSEFTHNVIHQFRIGFGSLNSNWNFNQQTLEMPLKAGIFCEKSRNLAFFKFTERIGDLSVFLKTKKSKRLKRLSNIRIFQNSWQFLLVERSINDITLGSR